MKSTMTIGEVASRFGLATHVLRHWESMGLLSPTRSGDRRRYSPDDLYRVAAILRAKQAGLSLEDIGELESQSDPQERRELLRRHRTDLLERIEELRACLEMVELGIECEHAAMPSCPYIRASLELLVNPQ